MANKFIDLTGQKFGKLTVIKYAGKTELYLSKFECLCECGNKKIILSTSLKRGSTKSCGCLLTENAKRTKANGYSTTKFKELKVCNIEKAYNAFWQKVELTANDNLCWNWIGALKSEYGVVTVERQGISAHRLAYFLNSGIDPYKMQVLHKCDNPKCVNPKHLFLGTHADNIADKVKKGRQAKNKAWNKGLHHLQGVNNASAKLDETKVLLIRHKYENKIDSVINLSKIYNVSKDMIHRIVKRKNWKHI